MITGTSSSTSLLTAVLVLLFVPSVVLATNQGVTTIDTGGKGAITGQSQGVVRTDKSGLDAIQRMMNGATGQQAVVTAQGPLAVRSAPVFGTNIIGTIAKGQQLTIKSRDEAWFAIDYPRQPAWVYITFVEGTNSGDGFSPVAGTTQLQLSVKQAAYNVLGQVPFPYDPATNGGSLGCAQVVSTILKAAGAVNQVVLGVYGVMDMLTAKSWSKVRPPPWKDGDVVTWATYDSDGDGAIDSNTHIGVVVIENGTAYAINNSSSQKRPVKVLLATYSAPVSTVLRSPGA